MTLWRLLFERALPRLLTLLLLGFLFVPVLVVIPVSLTDKDYLSLPIAGVSSLCATVVATAFAIGAWVHAGRWPSLLRLMRLSLMDSWLGVTLVHVVLALPLAVLAIGASLSNLDPRLVQAARSLGARPPMIFGKVILPNIVPGAIAGAVLAFITSWDEITVTLFITSRRIVTLPRKIWVSIFDNVDPALAAIATLILAVTVVGLIVRMILWDRHRPSNL